METKEKLWNRNYTKVMAVNFCLFFAFYLITPLLPLYLSETFHSTKDTIGFVLSGYILLALAARPFSGYIADTFNRKKVLVVCILANFRVFGSYLAASTLILFAIVRTLHGAPFGAATVANSTMAIDVLPSSRRTEGIGLYGLSNNLGSAFAPTIGILLYKYIGNFHVLFWIAFAVSGLALWAAGSIDAPKKEPVPDKRAISLDRFFLLKGWAIATNMMMFGYCYGVLSSYLAIYGKEKLGITQGTGTYFMLLAIGLMASRIQGARALRKGKLLSNALEGVLISTVGYTIFIAWPSAIGYYGSAILIGLGNGHIWPAFQNMIINLAQNNQRGTANSTLLTSWDLGMGIGILLGGIFAEKFGYQTAFWSSVAFHIMGVAMFFFVTMTHYRKNALR
ncbi:MAG: MFS transporter [Bacteroidales bacterium]|nr:MFS transporter [Bacteroidales bacterium]